MSIPTIDELEQLYAESGPHAEDWDSDDYTRGIRTIRDAVLDGLLATATRNRDDLADDADVYQVIIDFLVVEKVSAL